MREPNATHWIFAIMVCGVACFAFATACAFGDGREFWGELTLRQCGEYCESRDLCAWAERQRVVVEPWNTWSNAAYLIIGLSHAFAWRRRPSFLAFSAAMVLLGLGSLLFHASVTHLFRMVDVAGMFAVACALAALATAAHGWRRAYAGWFVAWILICAARFQWGFPTEVVLVTACVVSLPVLAVAYADSRRARLWIAGALFSMTWAFVFRVWDMQGSMCLPEAGIVQGHALWHLLSAVALLCLFRALSFGAIQMARRRLHPSEVAPES